MTDEAADMKKRIRTSTSLEGNEYYKKKSGS